jgi:pimeloyl-ACP methyl ester carboxylesterase
MSTVVAVDRAGLGLSDPADRVSVQSQVDDLAALLAQIGPAIVVGHSWGGLLVQVVAWQQPGSVVGLILVDPSHEEISASMPLRLRFVVAALGPALTLIHRVGLFPRLARPMGRRLAMLCTAEPDLRAAIEDAYLSSYRGRHQVAMIGKENRLAQTSVALVRTARATSRAVDVPLIVLVATTGKPRALQDQSAHLLAAVAAAAPRGRQILVENAGHYIHHDRPDAVGEAIAAVLAKVRPGRLISPPASTTSLACSRTPSPDAGWLTSAHSTRRPSPARPPAGPRTAVVRKALDTLATLLDGRPAAPNTVARKRAVFYGSLRYAVERGYWRRIRSTMCSGLLPSRSRRLTAGWWSIRTRRCDCSRP